MALSTNLYMVSPYTRRWVSSAATSGGVSQCTLGREESRHLYRRAWKNEDAHPVGREERWGEGGRDRSSPNNLGSTVAHPGGGGRGSWVSSPMNLIGTSINNRDLHQQTWERPLKHPGGEWGDRLLHWYTWVGEP